MRDLAGGPPDKNLTEVIERVLVRHHAALREAADAVAAEARAATGTTEPQHNSVAQARPPTQVQLQRRARREQRLARYWLYKVQRKASREHSVRFVEV